MTLNQSFLFQTVMKKLFLIIFILITIALLVFVRPMVMTDNQSGQRQVKTKFAVLSDTHSDSENTRKALKQAKDLGAKFIMNTGDLTKVGSTDELNGAKEDFESINLPYYLIPGDHDIYNSAGTGNFRDIIGPSYYSTDLNGLHLISLDTSDTSVGLDSDQLSWLKSDLDASRDHLTFIFMHLPVYHPTSPRTIWEKGGNNLEVKKQAEEVISLLKGRGILATFAGDHHFSSNYTEPESNVKMYIVGAATRERNLQRPRFDMVTVYNDNSFEVEEVIIEE